MWEGGVCRARHYIQRKSHTALVGGAVRGACCRYPGEDTSVIHLFSGWRRITARTMVIMEVAQELGLSKILIFWL